MPSIHPTADASLQEEPTDPMSSPGPLERIEPKCPSDFLQTLAMSWLLAPSDSWIEAALDQAVTRRCFAEEVDRDLLDDLVMCAKTEQGIKGADEEDESR